MASQPILCYVTDRVGLHKSNERRDGGFVPAETNVNGALLERIRGAATAGVDWIQVREKDLETGALLDLARGAIAAARSGWGGFTGGAGDQKRTHILNRILINDRLDVACAAGADGVHLGEGSIPIREVSGKLAQWKRVAQRADFLAGVSCHSVEAGIAAARDGAGYIFFGPVFATPSKISFGPPQGVDALGELCRAVKIPVLAIGGISMENAKECLQAGCAGIAAIRLFQEAKNVGRLVAELKELGHSERRGA
jgi:thiamine-phosphate pyrophosphorylase